MNGRGGVRPETVERVVSAARALDYPRRLPAAHRGLTRIEVILVRPETTFFSRLTEAFARIAETLDASVTLHRTFMDEHDPGAIAAHIRDPGFRRAGLVLAVPDHPLVRDALRRVHAEALPIVQIVTASPGVEAPYVGIDNYAAGRMAGLLISRMQPRSGALSLSATARSISCIGTGFAACPIISGIIPVRTSLSREFSSAATRAI